MPMCRYCAKAEREAEKEAKPRKQLKRTKTKRHISPAEMTALEQRVMLRDGRCLMIDHHEGMCDGKTDAHHLVPQRTLAAHYEDGHKVFTDERNAVALCRHHHNLIERALAYLPDEVLPDGFQQFLDTYEFRVDWDAANARRAA